MRQEVPGPGRQCSQAPDFLLLETNSHEFKVTQGALYLRPAQFQGTKCCHKQGVTPRALRGAAGMTPHHPEEPVL